MSSFFSSRRLLFCLLLAVFLLSALCGCSKSSPAKAPEDSKGNQTSESSSREEPVSLTLNEVAHSIFYAPQYVAIEKGYFKQQGIDLELVTGYGADKTMTALISGNADIGFMGSEASIYAYVQGQKDYAVNFAQLTQRAGNFLVSRTPISDFSWDMLKGKKVLGGRAGGMPQMVFEYILKQQGLNPASDLKIDQNIDFGLTAAAFTSNDADFTVEFEPHATLLEQEGTGYVVASLGEASGYVPYTAYCARKSYLKEHPQIIKRFTEAIQMGLDYTGSHSAAEIAEVIAPQFEETDLATITTIVQRYLEQDTWKADTVFTEESFKLLENILMEAGELEQSVPYSDLVY